MTDKIVCLSTCGSDQEARRIAHHLVSARVAACVNIIPGALSVYRWKGEVEEAEEWVLLIKSRRELMPALIKELRSVHSYELPELLALSVADGLEPYLDWIESATLPRA